MIGIKKLFACYVTAELRIDEISRRTEGAKLSCQGPVLRWSSPERKTYSRVGLFSYHGEKKGEGTRGSFGREGDPKEVDPKEVEFDWFSCEPAVVEII